MPVGLSRAFEIIRSRRMGECPAAEVFDLPAERRESFWQVQDSTGREIRLRIEETPKHCPKCQAMGKPAIPSKPCEHIIEEGEKSWKKE
jgi:hypothetical protein